MTPITGLTACGRPRATEAGRPAGSTTCRSRTSSAVSRGRSCVACPSRCGRASRTASSASPGCGKSTTAYAAVRYLPRNARDHRRADPRRRRRRHDRCRRRGPALPDAPRLDGLPGSGRRTEPDAPRSARRSSRRSRSSASVNDEARRTRSKHSSVSRSPTRSRSSSATRISCRAGCSSGLSSPSRWRPTRSCWSSTNRRQASTRRSRRASSTWSGRSRPRRARPSCSSPTISASSGRSAIGSA